MGGVGVDRLRGGVLAGLAVLVVVAGGAWWRAAAPTVGPTGGPSRPSGVDAVLVRPPSGGTDSGGTFFVDAATGRTFVVDPAAGRTVVIDAATARVLTQHPAVAGPREGEGLGGDVGGFGSLWEARLTLRPGLPPQQRTVTAAGSRPHLLQHRCVGAGELLLTTVRSGRRESRRVACDGSVASVWLYGGTGPIRIAFAASGGTPIVVDARLAALALAG
ncbi:MULTISPECIES: hypothetical protein [unclassified Micromonospora]|uniref:hypothetical protein n=1 Tax=unclassified Micromonospora TaxID=2617518 RepID=UPI0036409F08